MKKICLSLLVIISVIAVSFCGCQDRGNPVSRGPVPAGSYRYQGFDSEGASIVVGVISISYRDSVSVVGEWALQNIGPASNIWPQIGTGLLTGRVDGRSISIDLNPGWADNNVVLDGKLVDGRIEGQWTWITFAGPTTRGTFVATKVS